MCIRDRYTPYNNTNPSGYVTSSGVTSVGGSSGVSSSGGTTPSLSLDTAFNAQFQGVGANTAGATGEVRATGNITAYYSSDIALKENLNPIDNALNKVMSITGYNFDWIDSHIEERGGEDGYFVRKKDVGIVAQEIEKILQEAVADRVDGTKGVKYEQIIPLLVEAIKDLKSQLDSK